MSSTIIAKNIQVGTSGTATNNFNWYQPASPDGTVRLGVGNYGATTLDVVTVSNTGVVTFSSPISGSGASLTNLNGTNISTGTVAVARGGTGASTALNARISLGTDNAANLTSGTVATARLATTGTASATTFLRGDQSWSQPAFTGLSGLTISAPAEGDAVIYTSNTLAGGTYTSPSTFTGDWNKSNPVLAINSPSAAVEQRLLALVNGSAITIRLSSNNTTRNLTVTGTVSGSVGGPYTVPVNIQSDTGNTETLSELTFPNLTTPAAWQNGTSYRCRAWVNFNGTGTVAIRASGNVTSITDNGTGDYTVNFTTAMPDANYAALVNNDFGGSSTVRYSCVGAIATGSFRFTTRWGTSGTVGGGNLEDQDSIRVAIFR